MLEQSLTTLAGIGPAKAKRLAEMRLKTWADVISDYPRRYVDRRTCVPLTSVSGEAPVAVCIKVTGVRTSYNAKSRRSMLIVDGVDGYAPARMLFFSAPYLKSYFRPHFQYYFFGRVEREGMTYIMVHPEYATAEDDAFLRIIPIYRSTKGISQRDLMSIHSQVVAHAIGHMGDPLPSELIEGAGLISYERALEGIHLPKTLEEIDRAKRRLIFDELFMLQLRLTLIKRKEGLARKQPYILEGSVPDFEAHLPFELTSGQKKAIQDIACDLTDGGQMNRLIQGDVGSGKTVIAFFALFAAVRGGEQACLLAPTTLLAEQHYEAFKKQFPQISCDLLIGSRTAAEKREIKHALQSGALSVVIGTQALLQGDVAFHRLGLIVTDEQHRFGVRQRLSALLKSKMPHALIMSATPIPRTLSLTVYGDMDVSILDALPEGRRPIKTHFVAQDRIAAMYEFVGKQMDLGQRAYVVCPLIEASESMDLVAAETLYQKLSAYYPTHRVGMLHGKMTPQDKEAVMRAFKSGDISLLVSTTVIEVGIHVPEATLMIVVDAERFGLSQLHQLRGRVGRGTEQSYCFLLSKALSKTTKARIEAMIQSANGFEIAERDLALRGPGDLFGMRQHGLPEFKIADIVRDRELLEEAQKWVRRALAEYAMHSPAFVHLIRAQEQAIDQQFAL